jgi:putative oxidoreductase
MGIKNLFYTPPISTRETGLAMVRIFLGVFMIYHGWEVFDKTKMNEYTKWMIDMHLFAPSFFAYLGKTIELVAGIFILIGLFTRVVVIPLALTMAFICFAIGKGRIFTEEQYPFLFLLLSVLYFFTGPGKWSLDSILFSTQKETFK